VFYIGFVGHVSCGLGSKVAVRMNTRLTGSASVHCFCNAALSHTFDFSARSAIVRSALANRNQIARMTALVSTPAAGAMAGAVAAMLGDTARVLNDALEFDRALL